MSTGTEVIKDALRRIGVESMAQEAGPEEIIDAMKVLNNMLQMWQSQGIQIGIVPLQDPGDQLSEPADSRNAIVDNLAVMVAPNYDNGETIVSGNLHANAKKGYNWVKTLYQKFRVAPKRVSSTMPLGAGNKRWGFRTFAGRSFTLDK